MGKMLASCNCSQHLTILCLSTYHLSFYLSIWSLVNLVSPTHLLTVRAVGSYVPLSLMHFRALLAVCVLLARPIYVPSLCALRALFAPLKIFLEWISSLSKTLNFPKTTKGTIKCAFSCWSKNSHGIFWGGESF